MIKCGITEKRLNNRRFKQTEEKILKVFFEGKANSLCKLAKMAGIARTTVYLHHHRVSSIPSDYQHYILYIYKRALKRRTDLGIEKLFEKILLFVIQNKAFYKVVIANGEVSVIRKMLL